VSDGYDHFVSCLEARYDYQSARAVAQIALDYAGLNEQTKYSAAELQRLLDALAHLGEGLERVWSALGTAPSGVSIAGPEEVAGTKKPIKTAAPAKPAAAEPAAAESAAAEPAAAEPAAEPAAAAAAAEPVVEPATAEPAAKKPAAKKPAAKKPAAKKPAPKKPAAKKTKK
jgi:hypothetical protein